MKKVHHIIQIMFLRGTISVENKISELESKGYDFNHLSFHKSSFLWYTFQLKICGKQRIIEKYHLPK